MAEIVNIGATGDIAESAGYGLTDIAVVTIPPANAVGYSFGCLARHLDGTGPSDVIYVNIGGDGQHGHSGANFVAIDASGGEIFADDENLTFGTGSDAVIRWATGDASQHALVIGLGDSNPVLRLSGKDDVATDWNLPAYTHPTLVIHSDTTPATDYLAIGMHNGSSASIESVGALSLNFVFDNTAKFSMNEGGLRLSSGSAFNITGNATGTGQVVQRVGGSETEGLELRVYEATVSPAAVETNLINVPAGSVIVSVQSNVQTALTGGGTTVTYAIGIAADPDKYGAPAVDGLIVNTKSSFIPAWAFLTSAEQMVLTGAAAGGTADGNTALTVGSVRVRVVYYAVNDLDDA